MFRIYTSIFVVLGCSAVAQTSGRAGPSAHSVVARRMSSPGWLGIGFGDVTPDRARSLKLNAEEGIEIFQVEGNSPAARAGLKPGDVITGFDGQKVASGVQFTHFIGDGAPGAKVSLEVWRNGASQTVTATLESRPMAFVQTFPPMPGIPVPRSSDGMPSLPFGVMTVESPRIGFEGETLTAQLAQFFGVKEGVLVRTVSPKTPAEKAGLKAGDVIFKVSGTPVSSLREIAGIVYSSNKTATFTVMRNHKELLLNVEVSESRPVSADREVL